MSKHQEPIKPTEDKRKTTKKPLFSGSQENIVTHKLLVDTNEKAKHTIFENKRQLAGHASYSHRPRGQDRAAYNASFEPVKKARLFDAEREPQKVASLSAVLNLTAKMNPMNTRLQPK
jgi:hypothetical protein